MTMMTAQRTLGDCADCPAPAVVGLNGAWVCLAHFNARLREIRRTTPVIEREQAS